MSDSSSKAVSPDITLVKPAAVMRLFVIAKRNIYVDGLLRVINDLPGNEIVECSDPGENCFRSFSDNPADILLVEQSVIEAHLQDTPVDDLFNEFQQTFPGLRIIIFGREFENGFVHKMLRAGAHGFIDGHMTQDALHKAIVEVHSGGFCFNREVLEHIIYSAVEMERIVEQNIRDKVEDIQDDLTRRESDVLKCVLDGQSTREIAETLSLSEQCIKLHLSRLFRKFDATNRSQLILMAFARVCPVNNMIKLFRSSLDRKRIARGKPPLITDPLTS